MEDAKQILTDNGFTDVRVVIGSATGQEADSSYDQELVKDVNPAEGTLVDPNQEVILIVDPIPGPTTIGDG